MEGRALLLALVAAALLLPAPQASAQQRGPVAVPRRECEPSIHEGPSGTQAPGFRKDVESFLGLLPASYDWFGGVVRALGSFIQPFAGDPTRLGYKSGQQVGYDVLGPIGFKKQVSRREPGFKGIGKDVTDTPQLGVVGRECPGDPFWVGFPRLPNREFPLPLQFFHAAWDCFCRYDELVACPTGGPPPLGVPIEMPGPNKHEIYGGRSDVIPCAQCFGEHNIRKHDYLVGTRKEPHVGYLAMQGDSGYQDCLRQSITSFAGSGPGGVPFDPTLYGL